MVLGIQIMGLLFGVFMLYYSFLHFKRQLFTKKELAFWGIVWIIFLIVTLFPGTIEFIIKPFAFARSFDVYIVAGFLFLVGITFYNYTLTRKNQKQIEKVVRKIALERK